MCCFGCLSTSRVPIIKLHNYPHISRLYLLVFCGCSCGIVTYSSPGIIRCIFCSLNRSIDRLFPATLPLIAHLWGITRNCCCLFLLCMFVWIFGCVFPGWDVCVGCSFVVTTERWKRKMLPRWPFGALAGPSLQTPRTWRRWWRSRGKRKTETPPSISGSRVWPLGGRMIALLVFLFFFWAHTKHLSCITNSMACTLRCIKMVVWHYTAAIWSTGPLWVR